MIEEWRAPIVDSVVMSLVNGNEIHKNHFSHDTDEPGYYLTRDGLNIFLRKFNQKLNSEIKYLGHGNRRVSYRRALDMQIDSLAKAIDTGDPSCYKPIWIR